MWAGTIVAFSFLIVLLCLFLFCFVFDFFGSALFGVIGGGGGLFVCVFFLCVFVLGSCFCFFVFCL